MRFWHGADAGQPPGIVAPPALNEDRASGGVSRARKMNDEAHLGEVRWEA